MNCLVQTLSSGGEKLVFINFLNFNAVKKTKPKFKKGFFLIICYWVEKVLDQPFYGKRLLIVLFTEIPLETCEDDQAGKNGVVKLFETFKDDNDTVSKQYFILEQEVRLILA